MKIALALCALVVCVSAQYRPHPGIRPPHPVPAPIPIQPTPYKQQPYAPPIPIVRQSQDVNFDGTFQFSYETGNGIVVEQSGYLKNAGLKDQEAQVIQGSYSYPGPNGQVYTVRYFADETGFHADGDHLPKPVQATYRISKEPQRFA
ncbi:hypothetical protein J437_LFUL005839 [Ladona fulva]|uniref:Uncharacterized protein n=1 Tax=Ladona fulva TaxID=123851 RepID=A0A8K0P516_LADFU|nr:hypothetical protein J437_LFUL005839 [Ladona fulva]